jgi:hypothetical protein
MLISLFLLQYIDYDKDFQVGYMVISYILGYMLDAISGLFEYVYKCLNCGMPSDKLLTRVQGRDYTGCRRVRFYEADKAAKLLREDLNDENASTAKMFMKAMSYSNSNEKSRVPDFNAQYAFSRSMLLLSIIVSALVILKYPTPWTVIVCVFVIIICWNRFVERGYYYAREVLIEYIKAKA